MGLGAAGTAAVIGAGVSGASGLIGSALQSGATSSASSAAQAALAQQRSDLSPWRSTGGQANTQMADLLGLNGTDAANTAMSTFQTSPGYQWDLSQGLRGVDAGAAAKGMLRSGATLKAEDTYSTGLADNEFTNYYNRLAGISNTGESAAAGGASTANQSAQSYLNSGTAQSSIYGNTASGLNSTVNSLLSNPSFQSWLNGNSGTNISGQQMASGGLTFGTSNPGMTVASY